jgi:hypothetical protein
MLRRRQGRLHRAAEHARRLIEQQLVAAEVEKLRTKLSRAAARTPLPADLRQAAEQRLAGELQLSWHAALAELLRVRRTAG